MAECPYVGFENRLTARELDEACSGHGACEGKQCVCEEGYHGWQCSTGPLLPPRSHNVTLALLARMHHHQKLSEQPQQRAKRRTLLLLLHTSHPDRIAKLLGMYGCLEALVGSRVRLAFLLSPHPEHQQMMSTCRCLCRVHERPCACVASELHPGHWPTAVSEAVLELAGDEHQQRMRDGDGDGSAPATSDTPPSDTPPSDTPPSETPPSGSDGPLGMPPMAFDLLYAHADFYLSPRLIAGLDRRAMWSAEAAADSGSPFGRRNGILETISELMSGVRTDTAQGLTRAALHAWLRAPATRCMRTCMQAWHSSLSLSSTRIVRTSSCVHCARAATQVHGPNWWCDSARHCGRSAARLGLKHCAHQWSDAYYVPASALHAYLRLCRHFQSTFQETAVPTVLRTLHMLGGVPWQPHPYPRCAGGCCGAVSWEEALRAPCAHRVALQDQSVRFDCGVVYRPPNATLAPSWRWGAPGSPWLVERGNTSRGRADGPTRGSWRQAVALEEWYMRVCESRGRQAVRTSVGAHP